MGGKPLTNEEAWAVFDGFVADSRVFLFPEATDIQPGFRKFSLRRSASPKIWADAYLAATAEANAAVLVTFDGALATYGVGCTVLRPDRRGH